MGTSLSESKDSERVSVIGTVRGLSMVVEEEQ